MFGSPNQDPFLSSSRSLSDPQKRDSNRRMYSPHSPYFSQHPDPRTAPIFLQDSNARERLPDSDLTSHQMIFSTESPGGSYFPTSTYDFSSPTGSKRMDSPSSAYQSALSQTSGCKSRAYSVYGRSARHAYGSPEADCSPVGSPISMSSPASLSSGLPSGPSDDETCSTTAGPLRSSPWEEQASESVHRSQSVRRRGETRGNSSSGNRSPLLKPMPPSRNRNAAILTRISSDPGEPSLFLPLNLTPSFLAVHSSGQHVPNQHSFRPFLL